MKVVDGGVLSNSHKESFGKKIMATNLALPLLNPHCCCVHGGITIFGPSSPSRHALSTEATMSATMLPLSTTTSMTRMCNCNAI